MSPKRHHSPEKPKKSKRSKKEKKKKHRRRSSEEKVEKHKKSSKKSKSPTPKSPDISPPNISPPAAPSRSMAPMTKEEWERRQSVVRREVSPTTGRSRLIKGDGEVIEEIVSRSRHKEINKLATKGDGIGFQKTLLELKRK